MKPVVFRPAAASDIEEAFLWYEAQRLGLGDEFLQAVESGISVIVDQPLASPVVHRQIRRALLKRFPFGLFYVVRSEEILVVACFHVRRDPRRLRSRQ